MSRGSVSIDVQTEVSIDFRGKISVDRRVSSVDGGRRLSIDKTGVWVDGGWWESSDELVLLSIDEERLSLRIKRSKLEGSDENSSWISLLLLVLLGMHLKRQEIFLSESGFKKKPRQNQTKFIKRSKLPGNGAKFDLTQITLRSELLSQIKGSDVVLRDQIHRELGNLINLIKLIKLGCLLLNIKDRFVSKLIARLIDWSFGT